MTATIETGTTRAGSAAGKYLTFKLGQESYGILVLKIREIIKHTAITQVPQMPAHVSGVINLRGKIIPVTDLRLKFGLSTCENTPSTCIIVVQLALSSGGSTQMGLVVDAVEEVVNVAASEIEPAPHFGADAATDCILAMAKIKGVVKTLLDIDRVFAGAAISGLNPLNLDQSTI